MKKSDVKKYAKTKHKGLPKKVKQETKVRNLIRKMVREIMKEDFAGAHPKGKRDSFNKMREKQSEVLGYTLTGKSDIKVEIDPDRLRPIDADLQVPDTSKFRFNSNSAMPLIPIPPIPTK